MENIAKMVANHTKVKYSLMLTKSRKQEIVYARQLTMYLSKTILKVTHESAAGFFNLDHTTCIHSITAIENMMDVSKRKREEIKSLKLKIYESLLRNRDIETVRKYFCTPSPMTVYKATG